MAISQGFEALSFGVCEVGGYLLTKALSALWHCYGKKKYIARVGANKTNAIRKKKVQPTVGRGRKKRIVFCLFFFFPGLGLICELQRLK